MLQFLCTKGPLWSWLYGNWIYNYLCNQCLSKLTLWVLILLRRGVLNTTLCDKVCQWLATRWWWYLLCGKTTCFIEFLIVQAHWNDSPQVDMSLHSDTLSWFHANQVFFSYSIMLFAPRNCKYQFRNLWFDPARVCTHSLPNSGRKCYLLHHWCSPHVYKYYCILTANS